MGLSLEFAPGNRIIAKELDIPTILCLHAAILSKIQHSDELAEAEADKELHRLSGLRNAVVKAEHGGTSILSIPGVLIEYVHEYSERFAIDMQEMQRGMVDHTPDAYVPIEQRIAQQRSAQSLLEHYARTFAEAEEATRAGFYQPGGDTA